MDYRELAVEFHQHFFMLRKFKPQQEISESMHGEAFVLHYIATHDGAAPSEISEVMRISSARTATALNSLEKKGFITRHIDASDRRRIQIVLTPEGRRQAEEHNQNVMEMTVKMLSSLGEHDAREYVRITGRLAELAQHYITEECKC